MPGARPRREERCARGRQRPAARPRAPVAARPPDQHVPRSGSRVLSRAAGVRVSASADCACVSRCAAGMQVEASTLRDEVGPKKAAERVPEPAETVSCVVAAQRSPPSKTQPRQTSLLANKFLILPSSDGPSLNVCIDIDLEKLYACRVISNKNLSFMEAHFRVDQERHVNNIVQMVTGCDSSYLLFSTSYGDLHSYVRERRKLREPEARRLFGHVAQAVAACHQAGLVLRDLKLRKFVFADPNRTELKLESLEDAVVLSDEKDDILEDKRGCPAYVSPEILKSHARYSGRAADMWSLGVILYTMLVGRYPFNDAVHMSLFWKISRGQFVIPENISAQAKCLIRSLLRKEPSERLTAADVLLHPWFKVETRCYHPCQDQVVPQ